MSEHLPKTHYLDPEILQALGDLELVAREVVEGLRVGAHRSPLRGFSTEFAHHRQYAPGDSIRFLLVQVRPEPPQILRYLNAGVIPGHAEQADQRTGVVRRIEKIT